MSDGKRDLGATRLTLNLPPARPELDALLEKAKHHKMTPEERRAQRRSFVAGQIALSADISLEEAFRRVDAALADE